MLKITFVEFLLKGLPEAFLFICAAYIFGRIEFNLKRYVGISTAMAVIAYCVRLLPINYGVHTILCLFAFIVICGLLLEIEYVKAIKIAVIIFITQFLCEGINIFLIETIMKKNLDIIFADPMQKIIYTTPSTIIFFLFIVVCHFIIKEKDKRKN